MTRSISTAFQQAIDDTLLRLNFYLEIDHPDGRLTVSDTPRVGRPIVKSWGAISPMLSEDEAQPEAQSFDVVLSNKLNSGSRISEELDEDANGVACRLYACDVGPDPWSSIVKQQVFEGRFQKLVSATAREVVIRVDGKGAYFARNLSRTVSQDWPQAPPGSASRLQPLVYGRIADWAPVPVDVGVISELDEAIGSGDTSCVVKEDVSRWPSSGTIQFSGSELASYSAKDDTTRTLSGLTRGLYGTPVSAHVVGAVVMQRPTAFKFLLADPEYGSVKRVTKVRVGGVELASSRWSVDTATNILTIQPFNQTSGRPCYNRIQLYNRGLASRFARQTINTQQSAAVEVYSPRLSSDNIQTRPITNPSHGALVPWNSGSTDHFWNSGTDTSAIVDDKAPNSSTVKLMPNTDKTWEAEWFESYLPPSDALVRKGVSIGVTITPSLRRARLMTGTNWELKLNPSNLKRIDCTVNGVTKSWYPSGDDAFSTPRAAVTTATISNKPVAPPMQDIEWQFTEDEAPASAAPYAVTLKAVCGGSDTYHVGRIRALVQSVDGVLPWTALTSAWQATLSTETPGTEVTCTFDAAPALGVLAFSFRTDGNRVDVDLGGGRVARFQPAAMADTLNVSQDVSEPTAPWSTATVVVANPSTTIVISSSGGNIQLNGATLTGLTAGGTSLPLLKDEKADSVFLLTFGAYPTVDVEGYVDANTLTLLEHPCDVVNHYFRHVLGEPSTDVNVTAERSSWPASYKFAGAIVEPVDVRVPLVWFQRDSRSWIYWDSFAGKWTMRYRKSPATLQAQSANFTWGPGDWMPGDPSLERTADSDIIERVNLRYLRDWTLGRDFASYGSTASSGTGTRTADDRFVSDFVRSTAMAQDLADFYAAWEGVSTRRTAVVARPRHFDVDKGDVVELTIPIPGSSPTAYLQGVNAKKFLVLASGLNPHDINSSMPTSLPVLLLEIPS